MCRLSDNERGPFRVPEPRSPSPPLPISTFGSLEHTVVELNSDGDLTRFPPSPAECLEYGGSAGSSTVSTSTGAHHRQLDTKEALNYDDDSAELRDRWLAPLCAIRLYRLCDYSLY